MSSGGNSTNPNKDDSDQMGTTEGKVVRALTGGRYRPPVASSPSEGTELRFVPPATTDNASSHPTQASQSDPTRPGGPQYRPPSHAPSDMSYFDTEEYHRKMAAANSVYTRMHGVPESGEDRGDEVESDTEGRNPQQRSNLGPKVTKRSSEVPS